MDKWQKVVDNFVENLAIGLLIDVPLVDNYGNYFWLALSELRKN